jgi:hypothetical protein
MTKKNPEKKQPLKEQPDWLKKRKRVCNNKKFNYN